MSYYDDLFIDNLKDIIEYGSSYLSRAKWEDTGKQAICYKIFGLVNRYNTNYENVPPIGTIRRLAIRNCIDELLWIWQKKSNNIHDLESHIWDSWADENGSIGAAYGYQVKSKLRKATHNETNEDGSVTVHTQYLDQTDYVIHELKYNPFSRRILTDLYSVDQTNMMGLDPCCYSCTWNVTENEAGDRYLNLLLNQRSQDMVVANNWNVFQYWVLQNLFAREAGLKVGELVHVIADAHIYDRHMEIAERMIELYREGLASKSPTIEFPDMSFYDITAHNIKIGDYTFAKTIKNIPVAV